MRTEVTTVKISPLPVGATDILAGELPRCIQHHSPDNEGNITVRYAGANNLSVIGVTKEDKECIGEILQEIWESADSWFINEQITIFGDVCLPGRPGSFIHATL